MSQPETYKTKLSPSQQVSLRQRLMSLTAYDWQEKPEQYCQYRLDGALPGRGWVRVKQYTNGTWMAQAAEASLLQQVLVATGLQVAALPELSDAQSPKASVAEGLRGLVMTVPLAGTDESGKGDYFGPLVAAGVLVTPEQARTLTQLGVMDSKQLTDARIERLANGIVETVGLEQIAFVELFPEQYNAQYAAFVAKKQNLNHLLARMHQRVIQVLWEKSVVFRQAAPAQVIVDQFAQPAFMQRYIGGGLDAAIRLYQVPRAEEQVAVAAASIIARHRFVRGVAQLSQQVGATLPLGAGGPVNQAAKQLVRQQGREVLGRVAKLHFKTTALVSQG